ncbi:ABC transporter ATP-binding protein [Kitasatospora gansuensis]|uniref:ABC transporter ATP-binding protein n=1 Tax=Kitasatospora gansuensis TaxID=258050 RepID=UPI001619C30E
MHARQERGTAARAAAPTRLPTVVVDDVHVVYRTPRAAKAGSGAASALNRLLTGRLTPTTAEVHAVRGVSFTAYKGDSIGLIGSNGSGKSSLLAAVAGLLPTARGAIYTGGRPTLLGVKSVLMANLTGERNVVLGCLAMGMTPAQARSAYQGIVDFSGINDKGDFISLPMRTYSSGMAARLRFAIAAARTHEVLLIDEALATGDQAFRRRSKARIRQLCAAAGTVFLVSHNSNTIRTTCERTLWMESGELVMDGPTDEVVNRYERGRLP